MTTNLKDNINSYLTKQKTTDKFPLIKQYGIDVVNMPVISLETGLSVNKKFLIVEKMLEAHKIALANIHAGNITNRGFGANVCDENNNWELGANFNNTRNDISSICAERSAIVSLYNKALYQYSLGFEKEFKFKIKYICMVQGIDLNKTQESIIPCEDCLSWFNTNRYFDDETLIFSFEKKDNVLCLKATKLLSLLPYKNHICSNKNLNLSKIEYDEKAQCAMKYFNISHNDIENLIKKTYENYNKINLTKISSQNISASILVDDKIYCASKIDWTKRWFVEPLELVAAKAIEEKGENIKIKAVCYFGDEATKTEFKDGVVSIKTLGRIRQKYATCDTLLILNLKDKLIVTTIGKYLPQKFVQGYKII